MRDKYAGFIFFAFITFGMLGGYIIAHPLAYTLMAIEDILEER